MPDTVRYSIWGQRDAHIRMRSMYYSGDKLLNVRWEVLFHVVGMYENSRRVARIIMVVSTELLSAVADHVMAGVGRRLLPRYVLKNAWFQSIQSNFMKCCSRAGHIP